MQETILPSFPASAAHKAILFWGFADNGKASLNMYFKL